MHHFALLIGYGAAAINPYLAFETLDDMIRQGALPGVDHEDADQELRQGRDQGRRQGDVARWASRPSRATAARRSSRRSASTSDVIDEYFTWTAVAHRRHRPRRRSPQEVTAAPRRAPIRRAARSSTTQLAAGGQYQCRADGEYHLFNPRDDPHAAARVPHRQTTRCSRSTAQLVDDQSQQALHAARPARAQARPPAGPARGGRAGRGDREALQDRRHVATARSARRRTRRWPSP